MKARVLVVDDNCEIADSLVRLLGVLGYDAKAVYDGQRAANEAAEFLPDLVFIDIGMPDFDGYQTVSRIRGQRECAHAILVALTGWTAQEDKQRAYAAGFDLHVAKPMNVDSLMEILKIIDPAASKLSTAGRVYRLASAWAKEKTG